MWGSLLLKGYHPRKSVLCRDFWLRNLLDYVALEAINKDNMSASLYNYILFSK